MNDTNEGRTSEPATQTLSEPILAVLEALNSMRFGAIQMTVHEGKLVQVDITERKRFSN
ncbi:YezD family protein [Sphingorhabdus sp.]|uniref:YezD family protein n=1 Tax=Sphingorhabdus sp. TaxID=1902408 RepID=UPI00391B0FF6